MIYYVSASAAHGGDGSLEKPFSCINAAAQIAKAGDEVLVAPGVYREHVSPKNGGLSDTSRIIYRSEVPGAAVITGAEELCKWTHVEGNVWSASLPNACFHGDNPYADTIGGDWYYNDPSAVVHRGEVFIDGKSLYEAPSLEKVLHPELSAASWDEAFSINRWFADVQEEKTVFYVSIDGKDPNAHTMECTVRRFCFYPLETGVNYITLSGFTVCKAAPQWAPPTAYQEGMIGPHWAKGWIIEDCDVSESKCVGISLGKYLQPNNENKWTKKFFKHGTQTERDAICQAQAEGWSKETIGSHIVRRCHIHDCGQAGIVGHLGCVFSLIEDNHIHHINVKQELTGAEIGGIKLHAAIDTTIQRNHIHHCTRGLWLDWQAQGTRVTRNLFHHNEPVPGRLLQNTLCFGEDLFVEVSHGPTLIDHNLLLSINAGRISTQGIAFAHNLIAGSFTYVGGGTLNAGADHPVSVRYTPYHYPHDTKVAGFMSILHGDARFFNNIFVQRPVAPEWTEYILSIGRDNLQANNMICGTIPYNGYPTADEYFARFTAQTTGQRALYYDPLPVYVQGNVYFNGAVPCDSEQDARIVKTPVQLSIEEVQGVWMLKTNLYDSLPDAENMLITTDVLGEAFESEQRFEAHDGSDIALSADLLGQPHAACPLAGPFAGPMAELKLDLSVF